MTAVVLHHGKKIALVAHDNKKRDLLEWAKYNRGTLGLHTIFATGTTGETRFTLASSAPSFGCALAMSGE